MNPKKMKVSEMEDWLITKIKETANENNLPYPNPQFLGNKFRVAQKNITLEIIKKTKLPFEAIKLQVEILGGNHINEQDADILLKYFVLIDKYWNMYTTKYSMSSILYYASLNSEVLVLGERIKQYFQETFDNRDDKLDNELFLHEYNYFIGKAGRNNYESFLGGRYGKVLRNAAVQFGSIYPALTTLLEKRPLIGIASFGLKNREIEDLFFNSIRFNCGAIYVDITPKERGNFHELQLNILNGGLKNLESKELMLYSPSRKELYIDSLIDFFDDTFENYKLKNLVESPCFHFKKLVEKIIVTAGFFWSKIRFSSGFDVSFEKLVDLLGSWEEAETICATLLKDENGIKKPTLFQQKRNDDTMVIIDSSFYCNNTEVSILCYSLEFKDDFHIELFIEGLDEKNSLQKRIDELKRN